MKVDTSAKYVQVTDCSDVMFWYKDKIGKVFEVTGFRDESYVVRVGDNATGHWISVSDCTVVNGIPVESPQKAIDSHYEFHYTLTQDDIDNGSIKLDPYFVSAQWDIGSKDPSGVIWHIFKTCARFGLKNDRSREIKAIYKSIKRLAELENVNLE